jgi:hypothetical protein
MLSRRKKRDGREGMGKRKEKRRKEENKGRKRREERKVRRKTKRRREKRGGRTERRSGLEVKVLSGFECDICSSQRSLYSGKYR